MPIMQNSDSGERHRFPGEFRLKVKWQFRHVFDHGKKIVTKGALIFYCKNELGFPRLGIVASKKSLHEAVQRNYFKRVVRESFRTNRASIKCASDIVVVATRHVLNLGRGELRRCLDNYWPKVKL
jgi:ribonuclease P protein component